MKITLREISQAIPSLQQLGDMLTIKEAYWLSRDIKKLQSELETLGNMRQKLILKYGTKNKEGQREVLADKWDKFSSEIKTLLDQELEVDVKPIKLERLEQLKIEGINITTEMLTNLGELIEEPKVEPTEKK